ncbi:uncharacterized protein MYCFIDRAFT_88880 [Pseudocercospora fijiensis CIRAD86]|uniref:Uncharacterized protein n=1 Tax=Pseudocercospora fijiensis (strain CIRAD86) TaxID=383855 RepID=M3AP15_PSEFD|nr:uncharacterized protein MYCFIDRAFT_88880 [Pseudocercospora fijiensis CIRAD86]EME78853.1 hypothetical protein MYCFIDRAFT_88880 [Pseudocercospora fijiensis CIRAD86]
MKTNYREHRAVQTVDHQPVKALIKLTTSLPHQPHHLATSPTFSITSNLSARHQHHCRSHSDSRRRSHRLRRDIAPTATSSPNAPSHRNRRLHQNRLPTKSKNSPNPKISKFATTTPKPEILRLHPSTPRTDNSSTDRRTGIERHRGGKRGRDMAADSDTQRAASKGMKACWGGGQWA